MFPLYITTESFGVVLALQGERVAFPPGCRPFCAVGGLIAHPRRLRIPSSAGGTPSLRGGSMWAAASRFCPWKCRALEQ